LDVSDGCGSFWRGSIKCGKSISCIRIFNEQISQTRSLAPTATTPPPLSWLRLGVESEAPFPFAEEEEEEEEEEVEEVDEAEDGCAVPLACFEEAFVRMQSHGMTCFCEEQLSQKMQPYAL